jgi:hypothetical protein
VGCGATIRDWAPAAQRVVPAAGGLLLPVATKLTQSP